MLQFVFNLHNLVVLWRGALGAVRRYLFNGIPASYRYGGASVGVGAGGRGVGAGAGGSAGRRW